MTDSTWVNDTLTLCGQEIPVRNGSLPISDLSFYTENHKNILANPTAGC